MKVASEITQTLISDNEIIHVLEELPENWHLKLILLYYKDVLKMSWGKIYIKFGCVTDEGKPNMQKGERYKSIYKRLKDKLPNSTTKDTKDTQGIKNTIDEAKENCKEMV